MKTFFKAKLIPSEGGLEVRIDRWHSLKETECFHFCCRDRELKRIKPIIDREKIAAHEAFKRIFPYTKMKKIAKGSDRFASESQEKAIEKLRWLKTLQLQHMARDKVFIEKFLETEALEDYSDSCQRVPNTVDLVCEYYAFD